MTKLSIEERVKEIMSWVDHKAYGSMPDRKESIESSIRDALTQSRQEVISEVLEIAEKAKRDMIPELEGSDGDDVTTYNRAISDFIKSIKKI